VPGPRQQHVEERPRHGARHAAGLRQGVRERRPGAAPPPPPLLQQPARDAGRLVPGGGAVPQVPQPLRAECAPPPPRHPPDPQLPDPPVAQKGLPLQRPCSTHPRFLLDRPAAASSALTPCAGRRPLGSPCTTLSVGFPGTRTSDYLLKRLCGDSERSA